METGWTESEFRNELLGAFDYYNINYQTEVSLSELGDSTESTRRIDIYIPKTDTAIELKGRQGDLHAGVGQALNYTRVCKEAILVLDGEAINSYRQDIHKTCQIAPAVHFAMVIPNANPSGTGAGLDISTDSRPDLFFEMLYNTEWSDDVAVIKQLIPEYIDHENSRWHRPLGQQSLAEYQPYSQVERAVLEHLRVSPPVSFGNIVQAVDEHETKKIREALKGLCSEDRVNKIDENLYAWNQRA